ncbi:MAG: alpha/beta fold hydrolase [Gammaproteobacteria bacterium]|nr:alpha/beta fold hydrolase [Gammaproteobacteria bacterium]
MIRQFFRITAAAFLILSLAGCAPFTQYRTDYNVCFSAAIPPPAPCENHALQQITTPEGASYLLGFIEFDDQGQLWDRKQMRAVVDKLSTEAATKDLLMVVFVHGWKHNAAPYDGNVETFRNVLAQVSAAEAAFAQKTGAPARQVAGVYLGWRGSSITLPWIENITFWDRKNTALKVGYVGVTEVLSRLDLIKRDKDGIQGGSSGTRLVVVGHSFGGAVVNSALAQILENGFVNTVGPATVQGNVAGFGNLVVLINPAFEGLQFAPLSDMSAERGTYFDTQLPVMAILTSEHDYATRYAFPAGRWFSTFFEKDRDITRWNAAIKQNETLDEGEANTTAVGHFKPYRTHTLYPADDRTREQVMASGVDGGIAKTIEAGAAWQHDTPGSKIVFDDLILERTPNSAGRNPFLVTYVDKSLIQDHNDIDDPRIINFIKQLILISTQSPQMTEMMRQVKVPAP